jgi:SAM-dependent methyltransferase
LDAGCGTGNNFLHFSKYFKDIYASDYAESMVEKARSNIPKEKEDNFNIFLWDITNKFPLKKWTPVDVVTLFSVLPYIEDRTKVYSQLKSILKPGGYFVASFPNLLFDLFSCNDYTKDFIYKYLIPENMKHVDVNSEIPKSLGQIFTNKANFNSESGYISNIEFQRLNPLTISTELEEFGLKLERTFFMHHHSLPTGLKISGQLKEDSENLTKQIESSFPDMHWSQYFTCSTFMVICQFEG